MRYLAAITKVNLQCLYWLTALEYCKPCAGKVFRTSSLTYIKYIAKNIPKCLFLLQFNKFLIILKLWYYNFVQYLEIPHLQILDFRFHFMISKHIWYFVLNYYIHRYVLLKIGHILCLTFNFETICIQSQLYLGSMTAWVGKVII